MILTQERKQSTFTIEESILTKHDIVDIFQNLRDEELEDIVFLLNEECKYKLRGFLEKYDFSNRYGDLTNVRTN